MIALAFIGLFTMAAIAIVTIAIIGGALVMETPQEIAARYGATAPADLTITKVTRGKSSFILPVWDGFKLVNAETKEERIARRKRIQAQNMKTDASAKVRAMHAEGLTVMQMINRSGMANNTIRRHLKNMMLKPHTLSKEERAKLLGYSGAILTLKSNAASLRKGREERSRLAWKMRQDGMKVNDICESMGLGKSTVERYLKIEAAK